VLAAAGLDRLGRTEWVHQRFSPDELCPAPGQGALAIETRSGSHPIDEARDLFVAQAIAGLDDSETRFCVEVERIVLDALGGGCSLPIGVHCLPVFEGWRVFAQVIAPDGESMVAIDTEAPASIDSESLGEKIADDLKSRGALQLLTPSVI
jgi:hydroxymethylbilane synthase